MVEIDDRKFKILQAVVRNYLETGEPVGSRTISKYTDLNLSSATFGMKWRIWKSLVISCSLILLQGGFLLIRAIVYMLTT